MRKVEEKGRRSKIGRAAHNVHEVNRESLNPCKLCEGRETERTRKRKIQKAGFYVQPTSETNKPPLWKA